jgi:hypothetical protein
VSETLPTPEPAPLPRAPFRLPPFRLPADYYSSPVAEVRPVFDKWVPFGCGTLAMIFVAFLFIGGAFAGRGGMGSLFDAVFSMMQSELTNAFTKDVTPPQRSAFDAEYTAFRANLRANRVELPKVQELLKTVSAAQEDSKVTTDEVQRLTKEMHALNAAAVSKTHR